MYTYFIYNVVLEYFWWRLKIGDTWIMVRRETSQVDLEFWKLWIIETGSIKNLIKIKGGSRMFYEFMRYAVFVLIMLKTIMFSGWVHIYIIRLDTMRLYIFYCTVAEKWYYIWVSFHNDIYY